MIRVVVADDSPTARALVTQVLDSEPGIQVVGQASNGAEAVDLAVRLKPDLITMDVHMPAMDGLEATRDIMVRAPTPIIIVSSSTSGGEVGLSLDALRAGALLVLEKPGDPRAPTFSGRRRELVSMVRAMAGVRVVRRRPEPAAPEPVRIQHRPVGAPVAIVAIAVSTGGPAALRQLLGALPVDFPVPIVIVQHIARGFVDGLAQWLGSGCPVRIKVAEHGERLVGGTAYLAPDDRHLGVVAGGRVKLVDDPPIHGLRPSANYLFETVARVYRGASVTVIMTGMGNDGIEGLQAAKAVGAHVLAQDEATSVVFGMPREAIAAGVVDAVLPVEQIAPRLVALLGRSR